jgi:UDPglucose 6-dehydrogenase
VAQTVELVEGAVGGAAGKRVAVWGASFKAGTDDVRDSIGLVVADKLRSLGATVTVYDPMASGNALVAYPELAYADSALTAAAGADAIVVVTAWPEFAQASAAEVAGVVSGKAIVDACQGIDIAAWGDAGWRASSLTGGRGTGSRDNSVSAGTPGNVTGR